MNEHKKTAPKIIAKTRNGYFSNETELKSKKIKEVTDAIINEVKKVSDLVCNFFIDGDGKVIINWKFKEGTNVKWLNSYLNNLAI